MDILGSDGDRRGSGRDSGFKSGVVVSLDGSTRDACVVANMSETGALLLVERPEQLEDQLVLRIDGDESHRAARIVWRTTASVSVSFLDKETNDAAREGWIFAPDTAKSA